MLLNSLLIALQKKLLHLRRKTEMIFGKIWTSVCYYKNRFSTIENGVNFN